MNTPTAHFGTWFRIGAAAALGALVVTAAAFFFYSVRAVLLIVLTSMIFAEAISPLVLRLRRFGAKRTYAVLAIYLLALLCVAGIVWLVAQAVVSESGQLLNAWPEIQGRLHELVDQLPDSPMRAGAAEVLGSSNQASNVTVPPEVPGAVLKSALGVIEAIFGVFTVFVITFYWIEERLIIRRLAFAPLKPRQHERAIQIWEDLEAKLGAWVRGQLLMMLTIAIVFGIGLTLLGVKYALPLAIFAGLVEIVPFVGPYAATIPPVLLGLSQSVQLGLVVAAFGLVVQLVEANILMPRVMGRAVGVSHLTVILGLLVGGKLMGLAGAFLAVPIAAAIQVLLVDLEVFGPKEPSRASQPIPDEAPEMPTREEVRPANPPARSSRKQSNRVGEG